MIRPVPIGSISCGDGHPLLVIAGPCVIEDRALVLDVANFLKERTSELGLSYV
ncbi:MAG: 3-deoxy-8-phosphooctulonate synthase, partial [Deltaproteobacteria bacterium]|nr:3-deoxy-8-phosphooctulonate synthase [Deltaproteobacteria bacterium]